ncbi:MAG: phosphotransferase [Candidatus Limnocylindria bacterium]
MKGRASQVTDLGNGMVLRTGGDPQREARLMALVAAHGFPVPRVHEVRSDALVMERIPGPTMAVDLRRRPWRALRHVASLVRLHEALHRIPLDGASLVHQDLHPENVLISPTGPVVIDWTNAGSGDHRQDVALTWLILRTSGGVPGRLLAWLFRRRAGADVIGEGLSQAIAYRLADANLTDAERARVRALAVRAIPPSPRP